MAHGHPVQLLKCQGPGSTGPTLYASAQEAAATKPGSFHPTETGWFVELNHDGMVVFTENLKGLELRKELIGPNGELQGGTDHSCSIRPRGPGEGPLGCEDFDVSLIISFQMLG